jgi:hypothetical protein
MRRMTLLLALVVLGLRGGSLAQTFPQVVAHVSLTDQSHPIKNTAIYTPPVAGLFRATIDMILTTPAQNNTLFWVAYIQWTDQDGRSEKQTQQPGSPVNAKPPLASISLTYAFKAAASQPIDYSVQLGDPSSIYSIDVTLEQLQ